MIEEYEDLMLNISFTNQNWFPRFIIIRRQVGSSELGENPDEWQGFIKQIRRQLRQETTNLKEMLTQTINSSTASTKKELEANKNETAN